MTGQASISEGEEQDKLLPGDATMAILGTSSFGPDIAASHYLVQASIAARKASIPSSNGQREALEKLRKAENKEHQFHCMLWPQDTRK